MLKKLTLTIFTLIILLIGFYTALKPQNIKSKNSNIQTSQNVIHWKMANTWGQGMPVFEATTLRFVKNIKEMTNGRLIIEVHASNKHKAPFGIFDMVRENQYQMGHTGSYYWKGKDIVMPLFTTIPFSFNIIEQYAWFYFGGGMELMEQAYAKHGLLSFPAGNTGVQMGGWFKKPIESLADMQNLKMRIPGLAGDIVAKLGVKPTNIPPGELYTSLQLGTIDALEWVSPALDIKMGFHQIAKNYYTGWHEPAAELQYLVNKTAFDSLPSDLQSILKIAMREAAYDMTIDMFYKNTIAWNELRSKHADVKIRTLPKDVIQALKKQTQVVLNELASKSAEANTIIKSQRDFLQLANDWTHVGEKPYLETRGQHLKRP